MLLACAPTPIEERRTSAEPEARTAVAASEVFDGEAAYAWLLELMRWPRVLGDPDRDRSIDALGRVLAEQGASVRTQRFTAEDPATGQPYALANVIAEFRPAAARRFLLATHFDVRPWADEDPDPRFRERPVPGANDGTSGLAVLFELVPLLLRELPADVGFSIVLFDGEELGRPGRGGYCMGSRHFTAHAGDVADAPWRRSAFGIVLDMVGGRDLRLTVEPGSAKIHPALVERLWQTAATHGLSAFDPTLHPFEILDDHRFLTTAGVPSILLIDHTYAAWHTHDDVPAHVSKESLGQVGEALRLTLLAHSRGEAPIGPAR